MPKLDGDIVSLTFHVQGASSPMVPQGINVPHGPPRIGERVTFRMRSYCVADVEWQHVDIELTVRPVTVTLVPLPDANS